MTKKEFELELKHRCPKVFELLHSSRTEAGLYQPIQLGVDIGAGWFNIIMTCALKLESLSEGVVALQIKEKFGGLRFYINQGSEQAYKVISEAEKEAYKTCETCGSPGLLRTNRPWHRVLCDSCSQYKVRTESEPN